MARQQPGQHEVAAGNQVADQSAIRETVRARSAAVVSRQYLALYRGLVAAG